MTFDPAALGLLVAALSGAAVGIEREWSGHAQGPAARFAGVRTFTLIGGIGGLAGWLWQYGYAGFGVALVAGAAALVVAAYARASRADVDGTTEVAALVVLATGVLGGLGQIALACGVTAVTSVLLVEKTRLHGWVRRIADEELQAGVRFGVMAAVVLPLLPAGPIAALGGIRPRTLWALVLFFSGLSFVGYVARRSLGPERGDTAAGLLGGMVSSTNVAVTFARASARGEGTGRTLAAGVLAACTVLFARVTVAATVLWPPLLGPLLWLSALPVAAGAASVALVNRWRPEPEPGSGLGAPQAAGRNPLAFASALQMAALFQIVIVVVAALGDRFGIAGIMASGAVLGLTDVDALTLSMAESAARGLRPAAAASAIAVGIIANNALKLAVVLVLGRGTFRRAASAGLVAQTAALALGLVAGRGWW